MVSNHVPKSGSSPWGEFLVGTDEILVPGFDTVAMAHKTNVGPLPSPMCLPCGATLSSRFAHWVYVGASVPNVLLGHNIILASWQQVVAVMQQAHKEAEAVLGELSPFEAGRLKRVDVRRNFVEVRNWGAHAYGLARVVHAPRMTRRLFMDPKHGDGVTLILGNGARELYVYGKEAESGLAEAQGVVTAEFRIRDYWLRKAQASVRDPGAISSMAAAWFEEWGFGRRVTNMKAELRETFDAARLAPGAERRLALYLLEEYLGRAHRGDPKTIRAARRDAVRLGVALHDVGAEMWFALDYETGSQLRGPG
jgi:hypothetical protein